MSKACQTKFPPKFLSHHDNARPHCSRAAVETIESLQFEVIPHPPYSLNVAPSDCLFCFRDLKNISRVLDSGVTVEAEVKRWFATQIE